MKKFNSNRLHQIYSIFLSVLIIIVGALFLYHILIIYSSGTPGNQIYDVNEVKSHLKQMIIPICLLILMIIGSSVLSIIFPYSKKEKMKFTNYELLQKINGNIKGFIVNNENEVYVKKYKKCKLFKKLLILATFINCFISGLIGFIYFLIPSNFPSDKPNDAIVKMALFSIPFILISFASLIAYAILEEVIAKKQIKYVRKLISLKSQILETKKNDNGRKILISRIVVLALSFTFIVVGVCLGDLSDVLKKAITICSECIGLG